MFPRNDSSNKNSAGGRGAAVGRDEEHTVFRRYLGHRCAAAEKKRAVRTGGSTIGEWIGGKI
ncbi:MAG: hypothetical protein ACYS1A_14070 [Planctomycetota bacterium]